LPEIFPDVRVGEAIWFDDGKIGGRIHSVEEDRIEVAITHARPAGEKLAGGKGINLPDSQLRLPALTAKDVDDLAFIARHADMVGYSLKDPI
jgi:pyruvate kinase